MSRSVRGATPGRRADGEAARRREATRADILDGTVPARVSAPRPSARVRACVVVARVRGLTQLAGRLEPSRVVRLLEEFFATMTDVGVVQRAVVDVLLGEGIVLFFGVPVPRRDDPLRAVRTTVQMQRAFLALRNRWLATGEDGIGQLGLAIGVAAGEVLVASVRPGAWLDCTVLGEPVHTAAQLCAAARNAETLIDEAAHASACVRLEDEVLFTSRSLGGRNRQHPTAYLVAPRRSGLRVVPPRPVTDPVCGSAVDPRNGVRDGGRYFCSAACARRFVADPEVG
jgi:class 3 adenylate cyclase/YHS domain-containing protein